MISLIIFIGTQKTSNAILKKEQLLGII